MLVDGVRVKSPTLGQVDLSDLSPDLIERIEIIRGAQSTLYGADAIGGVVNIITRKGAGGPFQASLQQEVGNYDTLATRATVTGAWKMLNYAVSASHFESNGQSPNDGTNVNALSARVGATLPWNSSLDFVFRYNKNDIGVPVKGVFPGPQPIVPIINPNAQQQSETTISAWRARPARWSGGRPAGVSRATRTARVPGPGRPRGRLRLPRVLAGRRGAKGGGVGQLVLHRQVEHQHRRARVPAGGRGEQGRLPHRHRDPVGLLRAAAPLLRPPLHHRGLPGGGQQRLRHHHHRARLAGVRDQGDGNPAARQRGTGFRAPTFNDLFFPDFCNPDLQPEKSLSYDFGVDQKLWNNRIRLGLTYFQNNFTNLITCCVPIPTAPFGGPINVGRARSAGIEFTSEMDLLPNLVA